MSDNEETLKDSVQNLYKSLRNTHFKSNHAYKSSSTLQEIEGIARGLVQRLLCSFKKRGERTECDATALQIDFFRECYGNYSLTSTECPFCPLGLDCEWQESTNNKLDEADYRASVEIFQREGW